MNRMIFPTVPPAAVLCLLLAAAPLHAQGWAAKMFSATEHDFGTVGRNSKAAFVFEIENLYEEPVHIAAVRSSCGCTSATILKDTLATWEKGGILAELNTRSFVGPKTAAITVVIDRPYYAEVQLLAMGTIRSDVVIEPGQVDFGGVAQGQAASRTVDLTYAGRPDWQIRDVRGSSEHLQVRIANVQRSANQTAYKLEVRLLATAPAGTLQDNLVIVTDDPVNDRISLPVAAGVASPLQIAPSLVDMGTLEAGHPALQRMVVKGNAPFTITAIRAADPRLKFAHDGEKKLVHVIQIQADCGQKTDDLDCEVIVEGDLAGRTTTACRVVGKLGR